MDTESGGSVTEKTSCVVARPASGAGGGAGSVADGTNSPELASTTTARLAAAAFIGILTCSVLSHARGLYASTATTSPGVMDSVTGHALTLSRGHRVATASGSGDGGADALGDPRVKSAALSVREK